MKKLITLILFAVTLSASAQTKPTPPKQYYIAFTRPMLDSINKYATINSQVLSKSNWPTDKTFPIMQFILQIQQMFNISYAEQSKVDTGKKGGKKP